MYYTLGERLPNQFQWCCLGADSTLRVDGYRLAGRVEGRLRLSAVGSQLSEGAFELHDEGCQRQTADSRPGITSHC